MKNQVLSIERMLHLKELGVDTSKANMCWVKYYGELSSIKAPHEVRDGAYILLMKESYYPLSEDVIPALTLQDIIELLPKEIKAGTDTYRLTVSIYDCNVWYICYSMSDEFDYYKEFESELLIEAAYEMLCWCAESGYLKQ